MLPTRAARTAHELSGLLRPREPRLIDGLRVIFERNRLKALPPAEVFSRATVE